MDPINPHCRALASPSYLNFGLSIFIFIGILVSYLPQHYRIISLRSSFGISPYFVLLGTTSGTASLANILVLPRSAQDVACCREISGFACFSALLGIFQVGMLWFGFSTILLLFLIYFPRATCPTSPTHSVIPSPTSPSSTTKPPQLPSPSCPAEQPPPFPPNYSTAIGVAATCILHAIVVLVISVAIVLTHPSYLQSWANFLGVTATILASVQYFPQIYTTLRLRRVGSLSIPMMCIQTPGGFLWAASLAARLGKEGWSTWGLFVVTAMLQGTLLVMAVYFEYIVPKIKKDKGVLRDASDDERTLNGDGYAYERTRDGQPSEETPLLQSL
ncbi:hypothetical protein VTN00DRAFT_8011 [Thermoascus crustaceus]|uniref:uncharacterized protein n=1 Tax=Thermoascus crustaceus TaxID=5088 RepID=UPI0037440FC3